jgi:hypothetical protein
LPGRWHAACRGAGRADRIGAHDLEEAGAGARRLSTRTGCGRRSCWKPPAAGRTSGSPPGWGSV